MTAHATGCLAFTETASRNIATASRNIAPRFGRTATLSPLNTCHCDNIAPLKPTSWRAKHMFTPQNSRPSPSNRHGAHPSHPLAEETPTNPATTAAQPRKQRTLHGEIACPTGSLGNGSRGVTALWLAMSSQVFTTCATKRRAGQGVVGPMSVKTLGQRRPRAPRAAAQQADGVDPYDPLAVEAPYKPAWL